MLSRITASELPHDPAPARRDPPDRGAASGACRGASGPDAGGDRRPRRGRFRRATQSRARHLRDRSSATRYVKLTRGRIRGLRQREGRDMTTPRSDSSASASWEVAMVQRLLDKEYTLTVLGNRDRTGVDAAVARGATEAATRPGGGGGVGRRDALHGHVGPRGGADARRRRRDRGASRGCRGDRLRHVAARLDRRPRRGGRGGGRHLSRRAARAHAQPWPRGKAQHHVRGRRRGLRRGPPGAGRSGRERVPPGRRWGTGTRSSSSTTSSR